MNNFIKKAMKGHWYLLNLIPGSDKSVEQVYNTFHFVFFPYVFALVVLIWRGMVYTGMPISSKPERLGATIFVVLLMTIFHFLGKKMTKDILVDEIIGLPKNLSDLFIFITILFLGGLLLFIIMYLLKSNNL